MSRAQSYLGPLCHATRRGATATHGMVHHGSGTLARWFPNPITQSIHARVEAVPAYMDESKTLVQQETHALREYYGERLAPSTMTLGDVAAPAVWAADAVICYSLAHAVGVMIGG